jgi:hypothetical protein
VNGYGSTQVVIDLGVMAHEAGADPDALDDETRTPRPSPLVAVLLVMICCAAGLAAAGEPVRQPRLLFSVDDVLDAPRFVGDTVVTAVDHDEGPLVVAYALPDGRQRWRYQARRRSTLVPAAPVVLVAPASCRYAEAFVTDALDAKTGMVRWRAPGVPVWRVADASVMVFKQPVRGCSEAAIGFNPVPSPPFIWSGIDLDSGEVVWSLNLPGEITLAAGVDQNGLAKWLAADVGDTLTTYDLRTGAIVATVPAPPETGPPVYARILGAGELMLILDRRRQLLDIRAYGAPEMVELWRSTITAPGDGSQLQLGSFTARWCGYSICLGPPGETVGLEPTLGAELWRLPGRPVRVGPRYGLFVRSPVVPGLPRLTVNDLRTGEVVEALPETGLLGRLDNEVLLNTVRPGSPTGLEEGSRLWRLELATGELRAVTTLSREYVECDVGGRHLACRGIDGQMQVWRLSIRCPPACGPVPMTARDRG